MESKLVTPTLYLTEDETLDQPILQKNSYASEVSRRQYLNKRTADVFFTFDGSNERVPAHKSVLSAASGVFDKMFYGSLAVNADVSLTGKSAETFKDFLQFCYLDEVELKSDNITDVMSMLHEYQMNEGLKVCGRFLSDNWTAENIEVICSMYDWSINLQMKELQAFCECKIGTHSGKLFKTDGFLSCSFNVLDRIMSLDSLLCDESAVLGACLDWARNKCKLNGKIKNDMKNLREYLTNHSMNENLLYKIHYGSIAHAEYLTHLDAVGGLFEDATECEDVTRLLLGSKSLKSGKFLMEPRKLCRLSWNDDRVVECILLTIPIPERRELIADRIVNVLSVNEMILLGGFSNVQMRASYNSSSSFPVKLTIKKQPMNENQVPEVLYKFDLTFTDNREVYFQLKPEPIVLKPYFKYHFEFHFESSRISYERFELVPEIKINKHISIEIPQQGDNISRFIIKKWKINTPY